MAESTELRIVRAMAELLRRQGYAATGMKELADLAGAPTGSIYHHFKGGKRDVAAAALRQTGAVYIQLLPLLLDLDPHLPTAVRAAFEVAADDLAGTGWVNMCPVGTVLGEVVDVEPSLRAAGEEVLDDWVRKGTDYLTSRGLIAEDARSLTYSVLSALEGAFVLARAQRSKEPLLAAGRSLAAYAASLPVSPPAVVR